MEGDSSRSDVPLKRRRLHMLQTGKLSDCSFIIGESKEESSESKADEIDTNAKSSDSNVTKLFHCHKIILATASEVFERMFYGSLGDQPNPIKVCDIAPGIFSVFLTYIYSYEINPVQVNMTYFAELMYTGKKYMMLDFIDGCVNILLKKDWCLEYTLPIFELSILYDNLSLILFSYEKIKEGGWPLLEHPTFYNLNIDNMKPLIVVLKKLPAPSPVRKIIDGNYVTLTLYMEDTVLNALAEYGKRKNLNDGKHSEEFTKLVDAAACVLTPSNKKSSEAYQYLFGSW